MFATKEKATISELWLQLTWLSDFFCTEFFRTTSLVGMRRTQRSAFSTAYLPRVKASFVIVGKALAQGIEISRLPRSPCERTKKVYASITLFVGSFRDCVHLVYFLFSFPCAAFGFSKQVHDYSASVFFTFSAATSFWTACVTGWIVLYFSPAFSSFDGFTFMFAAAELVLLST